AEIRAHELIHGEAFALISTKCDRTRSSRVEKCNGSNRDLATCHISYETNLYDAHSAANTQPATRIGDEADEGRFATCNRKVQTQHGSKHQAYDGGHVIAHKCPIS